VTDLKKIPKIGVGGQKMLFKDSRKNVDLSSKFSDDLFMVIENCNKITTHATMASGARRSTKVGGGSAHKLSSAARRGLHTALHGCSVCALEGRSITAVGGGRR